MSCFFGRGREFRPVAPRQFHSNCLYLRNLLSFGPYCTVTRRTDQSAKGLVCDVECYPGDSWRGPPLCGRDSVCATPLSAFRFRALIHSYTDAYTRGAIPNLPSLRRSNHRVCGCRLSTTYLTVHTRVSASSLSIGSRLGPASTDPTGENFQAQISNSHWLGASMSGGRLDFCLVSAELHLLHRRAAAATKGKLDARRATPDAYSRARERLFIHSQCECTSWM